MKIISFFLTIIPRQIAVLISVFLFLLPLFGCSNDERDYYQGYIEGEYLHVSSPIGGHLETLGVARGSRVKGGEQVFSLDSTVELAAVAEARQNLLQAEDKVKDLVKGLRPSEIKALAAQKDQALAAYELARTEYDRRKELLEEKAIAREQVDRSRTEMEQSAAAVARFEAELETARLGARPDVVEAAKKEVEAARQRLAQAQWRLDQKTLHAPLPGLVFDTFYVPGEYVPAAHPVVSLLPPGNIIIRFFVPEPVAGTLVPEQRISFDFDGATGRYSATISYISPQAEYTPPVIYSRKSRAKLVYMIEARPNSEDAGALHPGQPVDVYLEAADG